MKIEGKPDLSKMELKRLYLPGVKLAATCPYCQHNFDVSLANHYPYGFSPNGDCDLSFLCEKCEKGIDLKVNLEIKLSLK